MLLSARVLGIFASHKVSEYSIFIWYSLFNNGKISVDYIIIIDKYSIIFRSAVLLISRIVVLYSSEYMYTEKFFIRFHLILLVFIISIIMLIFSINIISLILGWDGLGLRSYLLVIYYQSSKASNAGILTALRNRVGDVFIIIRCGLGAVIESSNFTISGIHEVSPWISCRVVIFLARITKRAQIPFSAWLPAAIAAPTPVSALVHSSTLVTAGVYLMIRFSSRWAYSAYTVEITLWIGTMTILIAGMAALNEFDTKKIVALSTLRQLGLIFSCISSRGAFVSYFHLITHAFIKAILFLSIGNLIHRRADYQDIRKSRVSVNTFPISRSFIIVANIGLMGAPFLAGFYSKDIWLEVFLSIKIRVMFLLLFIIRIVLTVAYRLRLIILILNKRNTIINELNIQDSSVLNILRIGSLWVMVIICGNRLSWIIFITPVLPSLREITKNVVIDLILISGILRCLIIVNLKSSSPSWFIRSMWGLPIISARLLAYGSVVSRSLIWKKLDLRGELEQIYLSAKALLSIIDLAVQSLNLVWLIKVSLLLLLLISLYCW